MVAPDQALQKGQFVVIERTPQLIVAETVDLNQQYSRRMNIVVHRFVCLFAEMARPPFAPAYDISKLTYLFPQTAEQVATSLSSSGSFPHLPFHVKWNRAPEEN